MHAFDWRVIFGSAFIFNGGVFFGRGIEFANEFLFGRNLKCLGQSAIGAKLSQNDDARRRVFLRRLRARPQLH